MTTTVDRKASLSLSQFQKQVQRRSY